MAPNSPVCFFIHASMAGSRSTAPLNRRNCSFIVAPDYRRGLYDSGGWFYCWLLAEVDSLLGISRSLSFAILISAEALVIRMATANESSRGPMAMYASSQADEFFFATNSEYLARSFS